VPDTAGTTPAPPGAQCSDAPVLCLTTTGPEHTRAVAAALADLLDDGDLLVLTGDLGAGKTCFTQGLGRGLGVTERVTSPTFTLLVEHQGRLPLHHLDVYRLGGVEDSTDLDLPDLLERGVTVIEWGDRLEPVLPAERLRVELLLGPGDDDRQLRIEGRGPAWAQRWDRVRGAVEASAGRC
jgi:tRNA threonylcarbamoyladenosine biosynthesis protein TsaE